MHSAVCAVHGYGQIGSLCIASVRLVNTTVSLKPLVSPANLTRKCPNASGHLLYPYSTSLIGNSSPA